MSKRIDSTVNKWNTSHDAALLRQIKSLYSVAWNVVDRVDSDATDKSLILVADDEPLMFDLIQEFLDDANIDCILVTTTDGHVAFKIACEIQPDLIIADLIMPDLNGLDLLRMLKGTPETESIPVILATGLLVDDHQIDEVLAAGAADLIKKPIDYYELREKVTTALLDSLSLSIMLGTEIGARAAR